MLEVIRLSKVYKPKKGVPVTALDDVSIRFPEKGMVFLLGKSGCGKSTLLNLLGGLDRYDKGEIIIKGVSSKDFKQQHFDSYRNTYVGFIFQEYNILEEFSVGANIALALELQGKRADDATVNRILEEVDLAGHAGRRPNELSGGQKQRVAIARALVKNPEIIMADEPTGALDSVTGRQVLDTLKKLSRDKLVIVVSHDREFAEKYADRIIELSDGRIISDREYEAAEQEDAAGLTFTENSVEVPAGYHLTEEDRLAINAYIDHLKEGSASISFGGKKRKFRKTDEEKIPRQTGNQFRLIKSKLPLKNAFKIGSSALKFKKFRLAVTVFLSCVAFVLFALADTFASYNHFRAATESLRDSGVTYASLRKENLEESENYSWWRESNMSRADLAAIEESTGLAFTGVYAPSGMRLSVESMIDRSVALTETFYNIYSITLYGYAEVTADSLEKLGYELVAGRVPDGSLHEIAISLHTCRTFMKAGFADGSGGYETITGAEDMVGKTLTFGEDSYTVTGVIDTHFNWERYESLMVNNPQITEMETLAQYILANEYAAEDQYSLSSVLFVGEGFVDLAREQQSDISTLNDAWLYIYENSGGVTAQTEISFEFSMAMAFSALDLSEVVWVDGAKTSLAENELIVTADSVGMIQWTQSGNNSYTGEYVPVTDVLGTIRSVKDLSGYYGSELTGVFGGEEQDWKIVGYLPADAASAAGLVSGVVVCDTLYGDLFGGGENLYKVAVGAMPLSDGGIYDLVSFAYTPKDGVRYSMQNAVMYELDMVNEALLQLSKIFFYIGLGFALFAGIMLANFIATSVAHKKQEIGILRAIGSRSNDVFRIFFAESFMIAIINFVLAALGTFGVTTLINYILRQETGILITILHFGVRQIALLFAVSLFVAFVASFLPVRRIAAKRPVEAIRSI